MRKVMRSGWSFIQKYIQDDIPEMSDKNIGILDTAFLLFLGIGLYFCGNICDKYNPKNFMIAGMILSASCLMGIGLLRVFFITDVYSYAILQGLNGLFESACLPAYMRMLGNWFSSDYRGLLMGIWNGSRSFGDSMGMVLGDAAILRLNFSWYWTLMLLGGIALLMSYMIYEFATETPSSKCLATIVEDDFEDCSIMNPSYFRKSPVQGFTGRKEQEQEMTNMDVDDLDKLRERLILKYGSQNIMNPKKVQEEYQSISIREALKIPGVLWYTLDFMCLKGLNYGILFWLPKFLQQNNLESNSSGITVTWSVGVLLGGILNGYLGDKLHSRRGILMPFSLIVLMMSLSWFESLNERNDSLIFFYLASLLIGISLGGPYNVQGPLIIDLGKHSILKGQTEAIGTVTGIIEGAGSLASSVIQLIIPYFGQDNMFSIFIVTALLAILFILPVAYDDYLFLKNKQSFFKSYVTSPSHKISRETKNSNILFSSFV